MSDSPKNKGLESLIEAVLVGLRERSDFPGRWCEYFSEDCVKRLREYGEIGFLCANKCEYCSKFKWAVDRAKHYAEKTDLSYLEILKSWEEERDYWFMNYYQDCKQPEIKDDNVHIFDTVEGFLASLQGKDFRCPSCGSDSSNGVHCRKCDWKAYGLLGCLGKGVTVFVKEKMALATIFVPIAWETQE